MAVVRDARAQDCGACISSRSSAITARCDTQPPGHEVDVDVTNHAAHRFLALTA